MRFRIEPFNEREQDYGSAVVGDAGDVDGEAAIAKAFEDAGVATSGCYRVRPDAAPEEWPAFYDLTPTGELVRRDMPCGLNRRNPLSEPR